MGRRRRRLRLAVAIAAAIAFSAVGVSSATAAFHLMSIREVYPGFPPTDDAEYVELQMYAAGQNFPQGHSVTFFDAGGAPLGSDPFPQNVASGQNQRTVLMGTPAAEAQFGKAVDASMTPERLNPAGGAVCFESIDCVAWGSFSAPGALLSPAGAPADAFGIPLGMALRRTIARGCATLLEAADDTDSSAADFFDAFPDPRPNSVAPSEFPCSPQAGGGGAGGGGANSRRLQTRIVRHPPGVTSDPTPTFRFRSNRRGARFQCRIDRRRFRPCRSPFTSKRLRFGCHAFHVRARVGPAVDRTPAVYRFRVAKHKTPAPRKLRRCLRPRRR